MGYGGDVGGGRGWVLVDQKCWRASLRWPFSVSMDLGGCLYTRLDVRPVQVVNKPVSIALCQLLMTGIN